MSSLTLDQVRAEADALGIKYHHRAGIEKIQGLINEALLARSQGDVVTEAPEGARDISEPGERWLPPARDPPPPCIVECEPARYSVPKPDC